MARSGSQACIFVTTLAVLALGCKDLTGSQQLPAGTSDPNSYNTPAGALGERVSTINVFISEWPNLIVDVGTFTDEAHYQAKYIQDDQGQLGLDQRSLIEATSTTNNNLQTSYATDADYIALQKVRGFASQALAQMAKYDPAAPPALRGELFSLQGYAEIMLADFFCSGVPLSTLDFESDYTYASGSTTEQIYQDAVVRFDSALALSIDSAPLLNLARVGKGRAFLDLGQYTAAAQIVSDVPDTFQYQIAAPWWISNSITASQYDPFVSIEDADREGTNGLPFISSGDPRSAQKLVSGTVVGFTPRLEPTRIAGQLNSAGYAPLTIADGIEARLIEAESALQAGNTTAWLAKLNYLRQTAIVPGFGTPQPALLPPLSMPASDTARISLMFEERAYWLYFSGHRQGDLRRLVRQYHKDESQVYPSGSYMQGYGFYGGDVTVPIPSSEYVNPLFHGCIDRNA